MQIHVEKKSLIFVHVVFLLKCFKDLQCRCEIGAHEDDYGCDIQVDKPINIIKVIEK